MDAELGNTHFTPGRELVSRSYLAHISRDGERKSVVVTEVDGLRFTNEIPAPDGEPKPLVSRDVPRISGPHGNTHESVAQILRLRSESSLKDDDNTIRDRLKTFLRGRRFILLGVIVILLVVVLAILLTPGTSGTPASTNVTASGQSVRPAPLPSTSEFSATEQRPPDELSPQKLSPAAFIQSVLDGSSSSEHRDALREALKWSPDTIPAVRELATIGDEALVAACALTAEGDPVCLQITLIKAEETFVVREILQPATSVTG